MNPILQFHRRPWTVQTDGEDSYILDANGKTVLRASENLDGDYVAVIGNFLVYKEKDILEFIVDCVNREGSEGIAPVSAH